MLFRSGSEIVVVRATIDAGGDISVALLPAARDQQLKVPEDALNRAFPRKTFQRNFDHFRESGMSRNPKCKYSAIVQYDPEAKAGDYQPSFTVIASLFRIPQITQASK